MDSSPTLHDFVLNLLCDPTARSAFELDPEAALRGAGLGDITAADVQEVIPLVVDYVPVDGIGATAIPDQLAPGVPDLDVASAARQLQAVTDSFTLGTSYQTTEANTTAASAVTMGTSGLLGDPLAPLAGLGLGGFTLSGIGAGASGDLSVDSDPAVGLDADVLSPVGSGATGVVAGADHVVADTGVGGALGTLDVAGNAVDGLGTGVLDPLLHDADILPATTSTFGSVVGGVDSTVNVDAPLHGVGGTVAGVGGLADGLGQPATDLAGHDLAGHDLGGVTDLLF